MESQTLNFLSLRGATGDEKSSFYPLRINQQLDFSPSVRNDTNCYRVQPVEMIAEVLTKRVPQA